MIKLILLCVAFLALIIILSRCGAKCQKAAVYIVLVIVAAIMIIPFYDAFVLATCTTDKIYAWPPALWFQGNALTNIKNMAAAVNFPRAFVNSCIVTISYTVLCCVFCSMGGYAFAVYRFPGRDKLFAILLGTMMIPWTAGIIPWFFMMSKFGWVNSFAALIIPSCANAFGIFWMRQYCQNNVPYALVEAAKIDGCSEWLIFPRIIAPILIPAYAALGIMQFVNCWNDFMQPMLILRKADKQTLPLMLKTMVGDRGTDYGALMMASVLAILPLLVAFLCASKQFMSGMTAGAIKE